MDDFKPSEPRPFDKDSCVQRLDGLGVERIADLRVEAFKQAKNAHDLNELCLQRGEYIAHLEKKLSRTRASLESQKRLNGMLINALAEINTDASDV